MPPRGVSIRIDGLREAREFVGAIGDRARRPEPALRSRVTLDALLGSEQRRFTKGFRPAAGREWVTRKRRNGLDSRTMRATGRMERALTTGQRGAIRFSAFNGVLTWGIPAHSPVWYAAVHRRRHTGWRVVVVDRQAREDITNIVAAYVADGRL